jgi:PAS domain S-box-containing protein
MRDSPDTKSLHELVVALRGAARANVRAHPSSIDIMRIIQAYINAHIGEPLQQAVISRCCAMSPAHFNRTFHQAIGTSFKQFVLQKRIEKSQTLLQTSDLRVKEIAHATGFRQMAYFTRAFKKHTGISPSTYRQIHQYNTGTAPCPLKATEASIQINEARLQSFLNAMPDYAIFMLDTEGRVATWNIGAKNMLGYTAEEIIGQHFSRFYTPEAIAADQPHRALEIAKREGRYEEEGWRVRKNRSRLLANAVISIVHDAQHRPCGFANITRDITKYKRE